MSDAVCRRLEWGFAAACTLLVGWLLRSDVTARITWDREQVNIQLGLWSTRLLIAVLAVSPLANALREPALRRLRRPLGLGLAAVTSVHAIQYLIYSRVWPSRLDVLLVRPYLALGTAALVLLIPLAATSTNAAVRRLGPRRWRKLHRLIYLAAPLALMHELMAWTNPFGEVGVHALMITGLLAVRLIPLISRELPSPVAAAAHQAVSHTKTPTIAIRLTAVRIRLVRSLSLRLKNRT